MKLFFYEFYKILRSGAVVTVSVIMLFLNLCCSLYNADRVTQYTVPEEILDNLYAEYRTSPEEVNKRFQEWQEAREEYAEKLKNADKYGFDVDIEPPPPVLTDTGVPSDYSIWSKLYSDVNRQKEYNNAITDAIERAWRTMASYDVSGVSESSYTYQYQKQVVDIYQALRSEAYIGFENTRGWDVYFTSSAPILFAMAAVILCAGRLFVMEKSTAFYAIGHASAKGRTSHGIAKFFAGLLFVILITVLMLGVNLIVIGATIGYGSLFNGIQSYSVFTYVPYNFTVLQYLICDTLIKLLAVTVLYSLIQIASVLFSDMILSYLSGITVVGISYGIYALTARTPNSAIHQCNLITLGKTDEFLSRYRGLDLFGSCVDMSLFVPIIAAILILLSAIGAVIFFSKGYFGIWNFHLTEKVESLRGRLALSWEKRTRVYPSSLFTYEGRKLYLNKATLLLIPALLIGEIVLSNITYKSDESYTEEKRREYIETYLYGEVSDEKYRFVEEEGKRISDAIAKNQEMVAAYRKDEITIEDFSDYMLEYDYAKAREKAYAQLKEYSDYLNSVSAKTGVNCWYIVENGWNTLLFAGADVFLLIYLVYCSCRIWGNEYGSQSSKGAFMQILLTTKSGRKKTVQNKFAIIMVNTFFAYLVSVIIRLYFVLTRIGLNGLKAPLISIRSFEGVNPNLTIADYLCFYFILQFALCCVLSTVVFAVALVRRNSATIFIISAVILFLPSLLIGVGVDFAKYIEVTVLIRFSELFVTNQWYAVLLLPLLIPALYLWFNRRIEKGDLIK